MRVLSLLFALFLSVAASAQAPETLANVVLARTLNVATMDHRTFYWYWYIDGSGHYTSLWGGSDRLGQFPSATSPYSGTFTYRKTSPTEGIITADNDSDSAVTLTFSDANHGSAFAPAVFGSGTFALRPAQLTGAANLSTRTTLAAGGTAIAGFILPPGGTRFVLIRGIGATLGTFGISSPARGMHLSLQAPVGSFIPVAASDWTASSAATAGFNQLFALAGAFPIASTAGEACLLAQVPPGNTTVILRSDTPGDALVEVYFLP